MALLHGATVWSLPGRFNGVVLLGPLLGGPAAVFIVVSEVGALVSLSAVSLLATLHLTVSARAARLERISLLSRKLNRAA